MRRALSTRIATFMTGTSHVSHMYVDRDLGLARYVHGGHVERHEPVSASTSKEPKRMHKQRVTQQPSAR